MHWSSEYFLVKYIVRNIWNVLNFIFLKNIYTEIHDAVMITKTLVNLGPISTDYGTFMYDAPATIVFLNYDYGHVAWVINDIIMFSCYDYYHHKRKKENC